MKRRNFIKYASSAITLTPLASFAFSDINSSDPLPSWIINMIKQNDASIKRLLDAQIKDKNDHFFGGLADGHLIVNPHSTASMLMWGTCGYTSPHSAYFKSESLLNAMTNAAICLTEKLQHEDGTIDLLSTNFHSTPDTAFLVKRLVFSYKRLTESKFSNINQLVTPLKSFLIKAGDALSSRGIHTPNHRWVVCAALAQLYSVWPNEAYINRINRWLVEKIDLDPDGQYNERSTYIYSSLSNRVLILMAKGANKPELLDYVRKNLDMTLYYVHPNGEVVTEASGRQDKSVIGMMENYYFPYRYLAILDKNPTYAAMCKLIEDTAKDKIKGFLDYYLDDPLLWKPLPNANTLPTQYVKTFPYSGLVRIRDKQWDASIIKNNPTWLTFMNGEAVLQGVRLASSFFGKGQFTSSSIEQLSENQWKLTQELKGPYYQPLAPELLPDDGDWDKMPRKMRPQSEIQTLVTTVVITKKNNGIELTISSQQTDRVPIALELIFREGGTIQGAEPIEKATNTWILKEGQGRYKFKDSTITFGPGVGKHLNTTLRGALPHTGSPSVFLTSFTPFKHTITIS